MERLVFRLSLRMPEFVSVANISPVDAERRLGRREPSQGYRHDRAGWGASGARSPSQQLCPRSLINFTLRRFGLPVLLME